MQRLRLRLLQVFQDDRRLESRDIPDQQQRRLAERRDFQKPVRLVGEVDIDPLERNALLVQRDYRALHIGTKLVTDQF
jgi:hypothetical protein